MGQRPRQPRLPVAERLFADPYDESDDGEWEFYDWPLVEAADDRNLADQVLAEEYLE